jgi:hypothetical protein
MMSQKVLEDIQRSIDEACDLLASSYCDKATAAHGILQGVWYRLGDLEQTEYINDIVDRQTPLTFNPDPLWYDAKEFDDGN